MALNSLFYADVPLRNYSLTHSLRPAGQKYENTAPKLSKFRILATNLLIRGDWFAQFFLRNYQHPHVSVGKFQVLNLVTFGGQSTKL